MPTAHIRLYWTPSVSPNVAEQIVELNLDGTDSTVPLATGIGEYEFDTQAYDVMYRIKTVDPEGGYAYSGSVRFKVSNPEGLLPATSLGYEIMSMTP